VSVAFSLVVVVAALVLILRGYEVRVVLLGAALAIGALSGNAGVVFRRAAESLGDPKWMLPICGAMAFAYVARETGCVDELVTVLLRPLRKRGAARFLLPCTGAVAFLVNTSITSQTSTLASVGPLSIAALSKIRARAAEAGTTLVLGSSIAGELLNPGVPQVIAVASAGPGTSTAPEIVVWLLPAALVAFAGGRR
jgi:DcuC family C4-dicarboxylate transporter